MKIHHQMKLLSVSFGSAEGGSPRPCYEGVDVCMKYLPLKLMDDPKIGRTVTTKTGCPHTNNVNSLQSCL